MLSEAAKNNPPINFNRQFPGSAQTVVETHEVPGAFSKGGWAFMKDAIAHADRYFSGEHWVLGDYASANIDRAKLEQDMQDPLLRGLHQRVADLYEVRRRGPLCRSQGRLGEADARSPVTSRRCWNYSPWLHQYRRRRPRGRPMSSSRCKPWYRPAAPTATSRRPIRTT